MNQIMNHPGIFVTEDGFKFAYRRMLSSKGVPNYIPPEEKCFLNREAFADEIMFLPIELDIFNTDRSNQFYGYRYFFVSSSHSTVTLGPDPLKLGTTSVQLSIEVRRFLYHIDDRVDIVIDESYDALAPANIFNINAYSKSIGDELRKFIDFKINEFNKFYMDRKI